jgi:hypothetical protein
VSEEAGRDGDQVMPASTSVVCGDIVFPKRILDGVTNPQPVPTAARVGNDLDGGAVNRHESVRGT